VAGRERGKSPVALAADILSQIPAVVHFASFEPLLRDLGDIAPWLSLLNWAIIGGESGPHRRPMDIAWLTRLVTQCQTAEVPVWVKQDSAYKEGEQGRIPHAVWAIKQLPLVFS